MGRIFGTDGARGIAITEITCEMAMQMGRAVALVLSKSIDHKPRILIGKDTRISSDVLESALVAGICSAGADAHVLGVVPTSAVAYLVKKYEADAGVMISASHNSFEFNGLKLFSSEGYNFPVETEQEIEEYILDTPHQLSVCSGKDIGSIVYEKDAEWDYVRHLMRSIDGNLNGVRVAVDCANGCASSAAVKLFKGLGATCYFINNEPDGTNINKDCGSVHMDELQNCVLENKCHIGIAFDGDGGRCLAVDDKGGIVDGDKLIAIFAQYMKKTDQLKHNAAVVTIMTNLGFFKFAKQNSIVIATANVGDRFVLDEMIKGGYNLGGEQSGHIIFLDEATTADGLLCAVKLLHILAHTTIKMSELATIMDAYPQVLVNVSVKPQDKGLWQNDSKVIEAINFCKDKLGNDGRILIRESGTEPVVRVMIEGKNYGQVVQYANAIARVIAERCH